MKFFTLQGDCIKQVRACASALAVAMMLCQATTVYARQPSTPNILISSEIKGRILYIDLKSRLREASRVQVYAGELGTLRFKEQSVDLEAGQSQTLNVALNIRGEGRQILHVASRVQLKAGLQEGPFDYSPLLLTPNGAQRLSYEKAFLEQREIFRERSEAANIDLGGGVNESAPHSVRFFKAQAMPMNAKIEDVQARDPREYSKMKLRQLPSDMALARPGDNPFRDEELEEFRHSFENILELPDQPTPLAVNATKIIKGHMSLKMAAGSYKAAWGWVVRAWQQVGPVWIMQGWDYVGGDGSWQISMPAAIPGFPVRVEYRTKNRFVSLQDPSGNPYTWGDNWTLTGDLTDVGYRYADLSVNGDLPGVDKLYVGATQLWVKFYNNGVNALRDQPIRVTYPNSLASGNCVYNDGSGPYAWSCSYWSDGRIYIIPAHASPSVVQHEIAHSINSYYWNANMPSDAGGSHNLWDCYTNGLALTEGWANFTAYWVQFARDNAAPIAPYFGMNLETVPAGVCANQTNETRVAAAFWDMYDTRNDGSGSAMDALNYVSQSVPIWIYLANNRGAMSQFLPIVQGGQSVFWQSEFSKLFRLNKIIP